MTATETRVLEPDVEFTFFELATRFYGRTLALPALPYTELRNLL